MQRRTLGFAGAVLTAYASSVAGQVQTFVNDFEGWAAATGAFSTIDFETLPDEEPSSVTLITATFNYTAQGATFSSPNDDLIIGGNSITGFSLLTIGNGTLQDPDLIRADLVTPALSIGFFSLAMLLLKYLMKVEIFCHRPFLTEVDQAFFWGLSRRFPLFM